MGPIHPVWGHVLVSFGEICELWPLRAVLFWQEIGAAQGAKIDHLSAHNEQLMEEARSLH